MLSKCLLDVRTRRKKERIVSISKFISIGSLREKRMRGLSVTKAVTIYASSSCYQRNLNQSPAGLK